MLTICLAGRRQLAGPPRPTGISPWPSRAEDLPRAPGASGRAGRTRTAAVSWPRNDVLRHATARRPGRAPGRWWRCRPSSRPAGWRSATGSPSHSICPASGWCTPASTLISVDLPAPFWPSRQCTSPARTSSCTPSSARTPGNVLTTSVSRSTTCRLAAASASASPTGRVFGLGHGLLLARRSFDQWPRLMTPARRRRRWPARPRRRRRPGGPARTARPGRLPVASGSDRR